MGTKSTVIVSATLLIGLLAYKYDEHLHSSSMCYEGDIGICTSLIESVWETDSSISANYSNRGNAYLSKGGYSSAIADFSNAIHFDPHNHYAYSSRSVAYLKIGNYEAAGKDADIAISLSPRSAASYSNRASVYLKECAYDIAISYYSRAISLSPNSADFYCYRGVAERKSGKKELGDSDSKKARLLGASYCL